MRKIFTLLIVAILATATSWAAEKTILLQNIGESASATSTESVSQVTVKASGTSDSYTLNYLQGKKHDKSILLAKNTGAFISNKTPIPGKIKSIKVYINIGASGKATYYCAFTSSECLKAYNQGCTAVKIAGGQNHIFTNTTDGATYFCISLGNANNGQVLSVEITYNEGSTEPQKTPTTLSFGEGVDGQTFTKYIGEKGFTYTATLSPVVEGATIDYSSTDENVAFVLGGEVELQKKEGVATIKASYAGNDTYGKSEASYTIDLKKLPISFSIPSGTAVAAGTKVTLSTIEGATLMYQIDGGNPVDVNSNTTDITIEKGCTIEAVASYNGANEGAQATYSIKEVKTITSFEISGTPTKTNYYVGEAFDHSGLKASATFSDNTTEDVTKNATWTFDPAVFNTTGSVTVTAYAEYGGKDDIAEYTVTVSAKPLTLTITPATGTYTSAQTVTIEANNAVGDVAIYYTTDGSNPEEGANEYTAPFEVATTTTVKAYAIDAELREATAESVVTIKASTFAEENFSGCNTRGGRDGNFKIGSGDISDDNFDCGGWVYDATVYAANSCVRVGTKSNGSLTSPVVAGTNYNAISFDIAGWDDSKVNTLTVTINNGGTFADGATSKSFTATNAKWTTFTEKITGLTSATTFTFSGKRFFLDSIILMNASTLAELAENGTEGKEYTVNDEMVVAKKFQKGDKNYIVVKDAAKAVRNFSTPAADDKFFNINGNKQEEYAQNNWMLISLPVELYNQVNEKITVITSITGTLTEKFNVAMTATNVVAGEAADFAPNTYCALNFMGESSVKGNNPAYTSSYYFATPKTNEYANVVWAVYNGTDGAFYLPVHQGSANAQEFKAAFKVDYSLNSVATPELVNGDMYSFEALVKEVAVATTDAKSAPRKTAYDSTVAPSTKFVVYPLDLDANKVATGVNDVNSAKEVKGVSYFNMMGVESAQPFDGVNIMVTTYTDGTQSATKVLR